MKFSGVYAAMVTPFDDDPSTISDQRLRDYTEFLLARGVDGLFALGATGEWPLLSIEERLKVAETIALTVNKRVPLIIHCGANTTAAAVRLAQHAKEVGGAAVSIIAPSFYRLDDESLVEHFTVVAKSIGSLPVILSNLPSNTGNDIVPSVAARVVAASPNVVGMKYSGDDYLRFRSYRQLLGRDFALFCGNDSLALPWLIEGADGLVSGNAAAYPEVLVGLWGAFASANLRGAKRAQEVLDEVIQDRDRSRELSYLKNILACRGISVGDVRRPLLPISQNGITGCLRQVEHLTSRGVLTA